MRYKFTFLFCGCFAALQGQSLHVHPFVSYGGTALEYTKAMIGNMAYDGIGKRILLEQYPESWADAATTTAVPVSAGTATDAFGLLLPKQQRNLQWRRTTTDRTDSRDTRSTAKVAAAVVMSPRRQRQTLSPSIWKKTPYAE